MPIKPLSPKKIAANRTNATKSTGPRSPQGKARSSQNARKFTFNPATFAAVRTEDTALVANLRADAIAAYQPINSQEFFAVERIALAQLTLLRIATLEAGLFSLSLEEVVPIEAAPRILTNHELTEGLQVTAEQVHAYLTAFGFRRLSVTTKTLPVFLRYQAQAERLYRRAAEELQRLRDLRPSLTTPPPDDPVSSSKIEPKNEPTTHTQPAENPTIVSPQPESSPRPAARSVAQSITHRPPAPADYYRIARTACAAA
jgi:hypothetical protein